ncbi:peptidylprolyl isomerase [Rasiella sp. SM2506]|uniref:peptidylprolyl isomerase n=1 Tax=Rasiella sp. SM2506 TaxID=3423914 RepID=UPI003D7B991C
MNSFLTYCLFTFGILLFLGCQQRVEQVNKPEETRKQIEMVTNYGTMTIELYNETPLHRDNFINLATNKAYDSLLFHRVIHNFMIQGGDPDSRKAQANDTLGEGDAPYSIQAEINRELFHKKGALAAARDNNPEKASSAMQFYIVQGKIQNDSLLDKAETYTNQNKAQAYYKNFPEKKALLDSIQDALNAGNRERYNTLLDSISNLATTEENFTSYVMPDAYRETYKTIGGYPRLDQNYTVFGEVVAGMEVIDSIAKVETTSTDRPIKEVRIKTVRVLN